MSKSYAQEGAPDTSPLHAPAASALPTTLCQHKLKRNFLELLQDEDKWEGKVTLVPPKRPTERNHLI